jgi:hypothetical protein
MDRASS